MNRGGIQLFSILVSLFASARLFADLSVGQIYPLKFNGLNGETLSLADGHITIVVGVTRATWQKAQLVGDRVPDQYVGDSVHRLITVVRFGKHSAPVRSVLTAGARRRLNLEAKRVQPRYDSRKVTRGPKDDIFGVADFEGIVLSKLGVGSNVGFRLFVFGRDGELLAQWNEVPGADELAAALK